MRTVAIHWPPAYADDAPGAVECIETRCPQLVVHCTQSNKGPCADIWTLTHAPTGFAVFKYFPSPEAAVAAAHTLEYLLPWDSTSIETLRAEYRKLPIEVRYWILAWDQWRIQWEARRKEQL